MGAYFEDYLESKRIVEYHHTRGERVVLARGTFDIFHLGHIDFLERAKGLGNVLMVNVNNDLWVKEHKGGNLPIRPEKNRAELVSRQEAVNYAFVHPSYDIHPAISLAILSRPDIIVREDKDPEFQELEKKILLKMLDYAPDYRVLPRSPYNESTSDIIKKMKEILTPDISIETLENLLKEMRDSFKK